MPSGINELRADIIFLTDDRSVSRLVVGEDDLSHARRIREKFLRLGQCFLARHCRLHLGVVSAVSLAVRCEVDRPRLVEKFALHLCLCPHLFNGLERIALLKLLCLLRTDTILLVSRNYLWLFHRSLHHLVVIEAVHNGDCAVLAAVQAKSRGVFILCRLVVLVLKCDRLFG